MLDRVLQFHRCIKHVPMRQLVRRGWLNIKRKVTPHFPFSAPGTRPFARRKISPGRLMPKRRHLVLQASDRVFLAQLGKRYDLQTPIDWKLTQLVRANHLDRLAIHYHEFLESATFEVGLAAIKDWIANNPWNETDAWKLGWNCYAISIRTVCWMQWLAEHSEKLERESREEILKSLSAQLRYLADNLETDIGGNHLLKNLTCLLWAGAYFEDPETDRLASLALDRLLRELETQFLSDGMHFELSPAYHCQVFVDLLHCRSALLAIGKNPECVEKRLVPAAQVIADLAHPDGFISLFADSGLEMAYPPQQCLEAYTASIGQSVLPRKSFGFAKSGYFGFRGESTYFLADCGPSCADALPAHGHGDMLAFEWDVLDKRILIDTGVFEYESGELRALSRATRSHNTVTLNERDQCEFVGSFRVGRRSHAVCDSVKVDNEYLKLEGHHSGFSSASREARHRRRFDVHDGLVKVSDAIEGGDGEPAIARLLVHDACVVEQTDSQHLRIQREGIVVELTTSAPMVKIVPARWFPNFGEARTTHQIELHYGPAPCAGSFELTLLSTGTL
jgi:uncharacterized heparinase superfamily protein